MKKVLFVCTGNTCRSPMAEAYFNYKAKECNIDAEAYSCGLYADGVSPISFNAKAVLENDGITSNHVSRNVCDEMLKDADCIFGLTENHARALIGAFPRYADRIYVLPYEIEDPFGGDLEVYGNCFEQIKLAVDIILNEIGEKR